MPSSNQLSNNDPASPSSRPRIRVAVVGATGYTGAELLRFLVAHPGITLAGLYAHSKAGEPIASVLPNFAGVLEGNFEPLPNGAIDADVVFLALPHGASAPVAKAQRSFGKVVIDLSADFRLHDLATYETWYGSHPAAELLGGSVYGLIELHRDVIRTADLIAVPGCYPTATLLATSPLVKGGFGRDLIVDAKSGVSGAGRSPGASSHFSETSEGIRAYKIGGTHRHTPEIEQELSGLAKSPINILFTPHLIPMTRGILSVAYATRERGSVEELITFATKMYAESPMVYVHQTPNAPIDTLWVRGSNRAHLAFGFDPRTNRFIAQGVIDNLVKGAAGQAIQCFNVRFGFEEESGLPVVGAFP